MRLGRRGSAPRRQCWRGGAGGPMAPTVTQMRRRRPWGRLLALALLVVPIAEIAVIIAVGKVIGVADPAAASRRVRIRGLAGPPRGQPGLARPVGGAELGKMPARPLADAALVPSEGRCCSRRLPHRRRRLLRPAAHPPVGPRGARSGRLPAAARQRDRGPRRVGAAPRGLLRTRRGRRAVRSSRARSSRTERGPRATHT